MKLLDMLTNGNKAPQNRTMEQMLEEIASKGTCWINGNLNNKGQWRCSFNASNLNVNIEIKGEPTEAPFPTVFEVYNKMYALKLLP